MVDYYGRICSVSSDGYCLLDNICAIVWFAVWQPYRALVLYSTQNGSRWLQFFHQVSEKVRLDAKGFYWMLNSGIQTCCINHLIILINVSKHCWKVGALSPLVSPWLDQFDLFWTLTPIWFLLWSSCHPQCLSQGPFQKSWLGLPCKKQQSHFRLHQLSMSNINCEHVWMAMVNQWETTGQFSWLTMTHLDSWAWGPILGCLFVFQLGTPPSGVKMWDIADIPWI